MEDELIPKEETEVVQETKSLVEVPTIKPIMELSKKQQVKASIITNVVKTPKKDEIIPYAVIRIINPHDCDGNVIQGSVANYSPLQAFEVEKTRVYVGKPLMRWMPIENVELV
jgi:hypothetical protein